MIFLVNFKLPVLFTSLIFNLLVLSTSFILKIGGRSSVEAKVGNEGSHNFLIVVARFVRFVQFWVIFEIPNSFWRFGVSFACVLGPFSDFGGLQG